MRGRTVTSKRWYFGYLLQRILQYSYERAGTSPTLTCVPVFSHLVDTVEGKTLVRNVHGNRGVVETVAWQHRVLPERFFCS